MSRCRPTARTRAESFDCGSGFSPERRRRAEQGLSLLELLIVVSLSGIFIGTVYETVIVGLRAVNAADEREDIRQQLANALDRFTREARMARDLDIAQAARCQFDADFDGDGASTGNEVNINYRDESGVFERVQGSTTARLVPDLTSVTFDYIDVNGADMTPPLSGPQRATVRVVQINITATNDDETISMASSVHLTNM